MNALIFFIKKLSSYHWALLAGLALSLILAATSITLLSLSAWFISASALAGLSITTAALFNYFIPAACIRFLALMRILSRYADRVINHDTTFKILASLRVWFYQQLLPLAPACLLKHRSGDLLNKIVNDIDTLNHLYLNALSPCITSLIITLFMTIFIAYFSIKLACIALCAMIATICLIPILTLHYGKSMGALNQKAMSALRVAVIEMLQGYVDLLLLKKEHERMTILDNDHTALMQVQKKYALLKGCSIGAMQLLSGITVFFILVIGIPLVTVQQINGAILAMIIFLVIASFEQLLAVPLAALSLGKSQHAAERLLSIAQEKPAVLFKNNVAFPFSSADIHFDNISFRYPDRDYFMIHDFNLTITAGEHLCITGPSGSGKTTLMHLLARIFDPTSGAIYIGDQLLTDFSEQALRQHLCYVTQHVHMFNASVRDNLTLMQASVSDEACIQALKKVELDETILSLPDRLNTVMGEFGNNFSGGQIRRIAMARALLTQAVIFIFDEPSAGIDSAMMQRIWHNFQNDFKNKTVIVISHDAHLAQFF